MLAGVEYILLVNCLLHVVLHHFLIVIYLLFIQNKDFADNFVPSISTVCLYRLINISTSFKQFRDSRSSGNNGRYAVSKSKSYDLVVYILLSYNIFVNEYNNTAHRLRKEFNEGSLLKKKKKNGCNHQNIHWVNI